MKNELLRICEKYGYTDPINKSGITLDLILEGALAPSIVYFIRSNTGCAKQTITRALSRTFPDRDPIKDHSVIKFILSKDNKARCSCCGYIGSTDDFYTAGAKGVSSVCKECNKGMRRDAYAKSPARELEKNKIRENRMLSHQMPAWADRDKIDEIYNNRPTGYHVDHIIPLNGELVSGLHVENNLQYLTAEENLSKKNKFDIT